MTYSSPDLSFPDFNELLNSQVINFNNIPSVESPQSNPMSNNSGSVASPGTADRFMDDLLMNTMKETGVPMEQVSIGSSIRRDSDGGSSSSGGANFSSSESVGSPVAAVMQELQQHALQQQQQRSSSLTPIQERNFTTDISRFAYEPATLTELPVGLEDLIAAADNSFPTAASNQLSPDQMSLQSAGSTVPRRGSGSGSGDDADEDSHDSPDDHGILRGGEDDDDHKCAVCGGKAGKHTYYGGKACPGEIHARIDSFIKMLVILINHLPGCRAFFRRAVQSKYYDIFFCMKDGKCEINPETR